MATKAITSLTTTMTTKIRQSQLIHGNHLSQMLKIYIKPRAKALKIILLQEHMEMALLSQSCSDDTMQK